MALDSFEESSAWAISKTESGDIVKDAIRKEHVLKDIVAAQSDLRALVTRVHSVQTDVEKLTSENATLQTYIDNLTMQMARRK
ncbi:hypothetical protein EV363DRAFT_1324852 [Boletus edulis]|uniref:BZIP transcription factor n=1 Tax=Boletus edulis BED1 TaxID=1328754 RepID=A0AAD4BXV7_BOLED|nr:hypothetical protein EV363DRAFT_1324852 [Boletus edulis]KAF8442813.1 hypothetical protein L210DRAFT_3534154 [Boletus edulis BED1]